MNTIGPFVITPLANAFNYFVTDPYEEKIREFKGSLFIKGGNSAGNEYIEKTLLIQRQKYNKEYVRYQDRFNETPSFFEVFKDNLQRLTVLSGLERFFALRQGYPLLKTRFNFPNSNQGALQEMFNNGVFKGYFRGYFLHMFHFLSTQYHALLYSKDYKSHMIASQILELVLYPIDTLKTRFYCDVQGAYRNYAELINKSSLQEMYRGVGYKLTYNFFFLFHLRNIYEDNTYGQLISLPLWALSYPLLAFKTRSQLVDSPLSLQQYIVNIRGDLNVEQLNKVVRGYKQFYAGLIPFILLNHFVCYQFISLYSSAKQEKVLSELQIAYRNEFTNPKAENKWTL